MAQTLQGDRVNRFTISSTANHTDESFEGNMDVSSLSSVSVLSRKKNVRIYARNAISGAWSVLAVVGPTASTVDGTGTKHHRDTTLNTTDYDRISVVTVDGADADVRVVHSSVLPSAILSRGQAASYTTEHELTSLAAGVAQTINNVSGMPIVQVFEQTTAAGVSNTELDVLRLHLDSNFTDSSASAHAVTANGSTVISTSDKKFGAGSADLTGNGNMTVAGSSDFDFGTGDFTIEYWAKTSAVQSGSQGDYMFDMRPDGVTCGAMYQNRAYFHVNGVHIPYGGNAIGSNFNDGEWHHFALVRNGTTVTLYIDGFALGSVTDSGNVGGSSVWSIGSRYGGTSEQFEGSFDDFRVTKGLARYTAEFTPPSAAHPDANSAGTSTLTDKTHSYTVTHDSSANQLSVTSDSPMATIKVRIATA